MPFEPKKTKFRKQQKGVGGGKKLRSTTLSFGQYGLKAVDNGVVSARQVEACRQALARATRKSGKFWIKVFPDRPITFKGVEVPMGGGKGDVVGYEVPVKAGKILFEIDGMSDVQAQAAFKNVGYKLSVKTKLVKRTP